MILSAREARARRAAERWTETNDARGVELDALAAKVTESAAKLGRDLTIAEVESVCSSAVAAIVHAEEQRKAQEALAGAREEQRLAYLAKVRGDILRTRDDEPRGGRR